MDIARVAILANPISGKGRSIRTAEKVRRNLEEHGLKAELRETSAKAHAPELSDFVANADLLVLAGGDGTLMRLLPLLEQTATPVYMLPTGNESLFAKQFNMTCDFSKLFQAIKDNRVSRHYIPEVNAQPFFTMVSVGLDSQVIELLARRRTGAVSRLTYLLPTLQAAFFHRPPLITLTIDGTVVLQEAQGFLIIANNSQYALGIGFVPEADSQAPTLSARFFPYRTLAGYFIWCIRCLLSKLPLTGKAPYYQGKHFQLTSQGTPPYPIQADGEHIGSTPAEVIITHKQIAVLCPPS